MPIRGVIRHEAVTVSSTAIGMTVTVAHGFKPQAAVISVEGAAVRFRTDGTDPTSTTGHELEDGDILELIDNAEVVKFRAIRRDGVDATLRCTQGVEYVP